MSQGLETMPLAADMRWKLKAMLLAATLFAAGCSSSSDEEAQAPGSAATPVESGSEEFPNLGTVPDQAPESTPKIERDKLLQQLAADRANAEYTDEPLTEETTMVPAAPPPPASTRGAGGNAQAVRSPAPAMPDPESAAASLPPPEVAALPPTSGDTAAVIFFQPGSDSMTDRDRAILHDVALLQRRQQVRRLTVVGHASKSELAESRSGPARHGAGARQRGGRPSSCAEGVPSCDHPDRDRRRQCLR